MKKLFILTSLIFAFALADAQSVTTLSGSGDTIVNTATEHLTLALNSPASANVGIQVVVTKISGTVNGNAFLYASNDGTNFVQIETTDSLDCTDVATNKFLWTTPADYKYFRVSMTGVGTMSASITGTAWVRKQ